MITNQLLRAHTADLATAMEFVVTKGNREDIENLAAAIIRGLGANVAETINDAMDQARWLEDDLAENES